ncbi:MAG: hypothetical protein MHM6MM_001706 [Cercozoa sp. M6MM]
MRSQTNLLDSRWVVPVAVQTGFWTAQLQPKLLPAHINTTPASGALNLGSISNSRISNNSSNSNESEFDADAIAAAIRNVSKVKATVSGSKKVYKCTLCDKPLSSRQALKRHLRTHSGERPFECPICQKRFRVNSNLLRHKRMHEKKMREQQQSVLTSLSAPSNATTPISTSTLSLGLPGNHSHSYPLSRSSTPTHAMSQPPTAPSFAPTPPSQSSFCSTTVSTVFSTVPTVPLVITVPAFPPAPVTLWDYESDPLVSQSCQCSRY